MKSLSGIWQQMTWNVTCIIGTLPFTEGLCQSGLSAGDCPNEEYLAAHCVTLPLFPEMREDEIARVIDLCNAYRQA